MALVMGLTLCVRQFFKEITIPVFSAEEVLRREPSFMSTMSIFGEGNTAILCPNSPPAVKNAIPPKTTKKAESSGVMTKNCPDITVQLS